MLINPRDDAPVVVGPYALFGMLATGGMATVHLGRLLRGGGAGGSGGVGQTIAIKRLHPQLAKDQDFIDMFLDEARIVVKIREAHVVQTLDVVDSAHGLLLIMEYVQGETLSRVARALRKRSEAVPLRIASALAANTLRGLHAAHETRDPNGQLLNVVHRDVSPQNIMVAADGVARVLDFGVAKAAGRAHQTRDGQIKGKLSYMAPEQLRGQVDRRTDVFAASIVLWELVTGRRLFEGASDAAVLARVAKAEIALPSTIDTKITPIVDHVIMRGLAASPDARYQTALEMANALERDVGIAPPEEVAAWVEGIATTVLKQRRDRIATIEARAASLQPGSPSEVRSLLPENMKRLSLAIAAEQAAAATSGQTVSMQAPIFSPNSNSSMVAAGNRPPPHAHPPSPHHQQHAQHISQHARPTYPPNHQQQRMSHPPSGMGQQGRRSSRQQAQSRTAEARDMNALTVVAIVALFFAVASVAYMLVKRFH